MHSDEQLPLTVFAAYLLDYRIITEGLDKWWFESDILHGHEMDEHSAWASSRIEMVSGFLPILRSPDVIDDITGSEQDLRFLVALLRELQQKVSRFLQATDFLGPLRPEPEREFVFDAERLADWQVGGPRRYLQYLRGQVDYKVMEDIDSWLEAVDLCNRVRPITHYSSGERVLVASVSVYETHDETTPRNLVDVAFGLSQVLPVIIQCLLSSPATTILIEQPELHLHPEAQAAFADLLLGCATERSGRFIIETHSEHLLLRLQRRIAETYLQHLTKKTREEPLSQLDRSNEQGFEAGDLEVILVNRIGGKSYAQRMQIDRCGQLVDPTEEFQRFFESDYEDVIHLTSMTSTILDLESERDGNA